MSATEVTRKPRFKPAHLSRDECEAAEVARVGLMAACPFYAHLYYSLVEEVFTRDIPTLATDGRRIAINPAYLASLSPPERVFALAHEVDHIVCRDPERAASYRRTGAVPTSAGDKPFDATFLNQCADYVRNALLIETGVGVCNPAWLYAPDVTGDDLPEDVYGAKFKQPKGGASKGQKPDTQGTTFGQSSKAGRGAKPDPVAQRLGGHMDVLLTPGTDPATGKPDVPDAGELKEAVARAAAAAKAMGKLPAGLAKRVTEILDPKVDWRDHLRLTVAGAIGARGETWNRPDRRRLVLNPPVYLPGKRGYGADVVAVMIDTSGSVHSEPKLIEAFLAELDGIFTDTRPRRIVVIECDARVSRVTDVDSLSELDSLHHEWRTKGVKGGGGTDFRPPFEQLDEQGVRPEAAVYLTDLEGRFPAAAPPYPVIWATLKDHAVPFGERVLLSLP